MQAAGAQIVHEEQLPARASKFGEPAAPLSAPVRAALSARGVSRLFLHQAQALNAVLSGAPAPPPVAMWPPPSSSN